MLGIPRLLEHIIDKIIGTHIYAYGPKQCKRLAKVYPDEAHLNGKWKRTYRIREKGCLNWHTHSGQLHGICDGRLLRNCVWDSAARPELIISGVEFNTVYNSMAPCFLNVFAALSRTSIRFSGSWLSKICVSRKEKLIDANVSLLCVSVCISVTIVRQASGFDRIFS